MTDEKLLLLEQLEKMVTTEQDTSPSVGKDLQLMAKELTDDRNAFRFANKSKLNVAIATMQMVIGEKEDYDRKKDGRGRYFVMKRWNYWESTLSQSIKAGMADRYKDLGGYLLAFRGGIEWRQAGINPDMNMDEQKMSIMQRMKK